MLVAVVAHIGITVLLLSHAHTYIELLGSWK